MKLIRSLSHRNIFDTNYKVYCIEFEFPIKGNMINAWLFKHGLSDSEYVESCNTVRYVRKWYRKRWKK